MTHIHTNYDRHTIYINMQAHFDTHTHRHWQTDRQMHTHISNHLPEPTPSVEVSQYRTVCARHQILHEGEEKAIDQGSTQHLHIHSQLPMLKATSMHVYIYLPSHSFPKIKAHAVPNHLWHPFYVHGQSTHPVRTTKPHTHTTLSTIYTSLLTVSSLWPLDLHLCIWEGREVENGGSVIEWTLGIRKFHLIWSDIGGICIWT